MDIYVVFGKLDKKIKLKRKLEIVFHTRMSDPKSWADNFQRKFSANN